MKPEYEAEIEKQQKLLAAGERAYDLVGLVKVGLFVLFAASLYLAFSRWDSVTYKAAAGALFVIQAVVWMYQARLGREKEHAAGMIAINRRYVQRIAGGWNEFSDTGAEFAEPDHPYAGDLDIVGKKSLFQFLNTAHTWHGRRALADDLLYAGYDSTSYVKVSYDKAAIAERQAAIAELAKDHAFASELEYRFSRIGSDPSAPEFVRELQDQTPFISNQGLQRLILYGPAVVLLVAAAAVIFGGQQFYRPFLYYYTIQMFIWVAGSRAAGQYLKSINRLPFQLGAYSEVLTLLAGASFESERLKRLQAGLTDSDVSAVQALKELSRIFDRTSVRSNPFIYMFLNVLLLWDFECAFLLQAWRRKYAPHCEQWFLALGELESLSSFAVLLRVSDHTCYPQMSAERELMAAELGHPLIPAEVRVTNPLQLKDNILIITGSNMSGKTTYLRTVGINLVLARAGSPVCAKMMIFADLHIHTSMRMADDLNEGISTFYAELRRIKGILEAAERDRRTLFLIDEIFRGTNSVDRLSGARTVLVRLSRLGVSGMITTHDLELCDLEREASNVENFSFSEDYVDGEIRFDYRLRPGKSRTTNAKYLMEMLGII